jgi:hypothetical protein
MNLLAVSEAAQFWVPTGISLLSIVISALVAWVLYRVSESVRRFERQEDRSDAALKQAEAKLHDAARSLIDERFRAMSHEMNGHVQGFMTTLDELKERLQEGDGLLRTLGDVDHQLELKTVNRMEQIKDYVRDHCASKGDVKEQATSVNDRIDRLSDKVEVMGKQVAVLGEKVEAR